MLHGERLKLPYTSRLALLTNEPV